MSLLSFHKLYTVPPPPPTLPHSPKIFQSTTQTTNCTPVSIPLQAAVLQTSGRRYNINCRLYSCTKNLPLLHACHLAQGVFKSTSSFSFPFPPGETRDAFHFRQAAAGARGTTSFPRSNFAANCPSSLPSHKNRRSSSVKKTKMASSLMKLLLLRRVPRALRPLTSTQRSHVFSSSSLFITEASKCTSSPSLFDYPFRNFCSRPSNLDGEFSQGPATIDYSSVLQEDEFHNLADSTIQDLLEKIEEYGDSVEIDGFDIDYGNQVLTVKLGSMGTYVLNKQTPNRQIWMSSPVSGPSRFDWDHNAQAWIYRRNKADLLKTLENEIEKLCGKPISLS